MSCPREAKKTYRGQKVAGTRGNVLGWGFCGENMSSLEYWMKKAEKNEADARRYRWLRDKHPNCNVWIKDDADKTVCILGTPMLDGAIDEAITTAAAPSSP
jgi:hypothetical protein